MYLTKIASVTKRLNLPHEVTLTTRIPAEEGVVVAVRALEQKDQYGLLELTSGRMAKIMKGDVIAGVLGARRALKGFVGEVPEAVRPGDVLRILNLGGVIGVWLGGQSEVGEPLKVEVLGAVTLGGSVVTMRHGALPWLHHLEGTAPLVMVTGTCMQAGKTTAGCGLISWLTQQGQKVAAAKLTGVAAQRDLLNMEDHGAVAALSFTDAGIPSTSVHHERVVPVAKGVLSALADIRPDVIVVELGDGLIGGYGTDLILKDPEIQRRMAVHLVCANDLAGAYGTRLFTEAIGLPIHAFSGPVTDNAAGTEYLVEVMKVPAFNVRVDLEGLGHLVLKKMNDFALLPTSA